MIAATGDTIDALGDVVSFRRRDAFERTQHVKVSSLDDEVDSSAGVASKRPRCREIETEDLESVIALLVEGFPDHSDAYWRRALYRLTDHPTPIGKTRYGYVLDFEGALVGAILTIATEVHLNGVKNRRVNVGTWYVKPEYRGSGMLLAVRVIRPKDCTFWNLSPAPHTLPVMDRLGFTRYCRGNVLAVPALNPRVPGARVSRIDPDSGDPGLDAETNRLLIDHHRYGCLSLVCKVGDETHPFVFVTRPGTAFRYVQLIYCRQRSDFIRFAGTLGRYLAMRGMPIVVLDANGPLRGVRGKFMDHRPKFFKGPDRPRLWDLAYTEIPIFGM